LRCSRGLWVVLCSLIGVGHALAAEPASLEQYRKVLPAAESFGPVAGTPEAAPAYRDGELIGYVFQTREVVQSVGYSGKPLDVLVGIDLDGRITGATVLEQHEPILVIGV